jgi:hypothetical protein
MTLKIPDSITSPQELSVLTMNIRSYADWFQHESIKMQVNNGHVPEAPGMDAASVELIHTWANGQQLDIPSIDRLINALEDFKNTAPILTITLAAPPTGETKAKLIKWCRENIDPQALISFKFNATLLGGMVIRFGSRVFDWSFKRQILADRYKFPEFLRNV